MGAGWLGWPPDVVLDTPISLIVEAYEGRIDMLRAVFGAGEKEGKTKPGRKAPPQLKRQSRRQVAKGLKAFFAARARLDKGDPAASGP